MGNTKVLLGIKISVILLHLWEDIPPLKSSTASSTWRTLTKASQWPLVAQLWLLCTPSTHWPPCQAPETELESMGQPMERGCRNAKAQEQSALQDLVLCFYAIIQMAANITSFFCRTDIDQVWFYFTVYQTCLGQHLIPDRNRHLENLFLKSVDAMR